MQLSFACFTAASIFLSAVSAEGPRVPTPSSVADTCLLVEYKGSVVNDGGNLASPVPIGDDLWFIDQEGGDIYVERKNSPIMKIFNGEFEIPNGLNWSFVDYNPERIINVAPGIEPDEIFVFVTSSTLPAGIPLGGRLPDPLAGFCCSTMTPVPDLYRIVSMSTFPFAFSLFPDALTAYQILYKFTIGETSLDNPTPIVAFEIQTGAHKGGGMATVNGKVLIGTADFLPFGTDGRDAPQDIKSHLGSILAIDPSDGSFDIVAIGLRNPQHFEIIDNNGSPLALSFMDIGGVTAEEVNVVSLADLFDVNGGIENFGWGRNADGKAREGTFYIQPGTPGTFGTEPPYDADAPIPEPGFIQPYAQYSRFSPEQFVAVTGPVTSKKSFKYEMKMVFADLPSGQVFFTKESDYTSTDVEVFLAKLKMKADSDGASSSKGGHKGSGDKLLFKKKADSDGASSSKSGHKGSGDKCLVDTDLATLAQGRPDPRFFRFPNGKAGVLLEATGDYYELLELPAKECECKQKKGKKEEKIRTIIK